MDRRSFLGWASASLVAAQTGCAIQAQDDPQGRRGYCRFCTSNCGLEFEIRDDRMLKVRGDRSSFTKGFICPTGASINHVLADPARLRGPLKRVGGRFEPCTWEEAISDIARRLSGIKEQHGARAISMQSGYICVGRAPFSRR